MKNAQERSSKEKAAEYYAQKKEAIKEKPRERYKNLSQEEKFKIWHRYNGKTKIWFWFWISHFADFRQVRKNVI